MAGEKGTLNSIAWLQLLFQGVVLASLNALVANATSPLATLYVSLHTADPTAAGTQSSNEAAYVGYARQAVSRSAAGWSISNETISNVNAVNFPVCTGGSETETYIGIGAAQSGNGILLWAGPLTSGLAISNGFMPSFAIGQITITEG